MQLPETNPTEPDPAQQVGAEDRPAPLSCLTWLVVSAWFSTEEGRFFVRPAGLNLAWHKS
jgi:hypothetical protein